MVILSAEIEKLMQLDIPYLIISIVVVLAAVKTIVSLFEWAVQKLGLETKHSRKQREEHELLITTAENLKELKDNYVESVKQSIRHDNLIKEDLGNFVTEINSSITDIKDTVIETQEKVSIIQEKQKSIVESIKTQNKANMEEMCDYINQKIKRYINELNGIPEDEYDDFIRLVNAYTGIGGNHGIVEKYKYCINNLKILPVKNKIVT